MMIFYILQGLEETIVRVELLEKSRDLIYVSVLHANWAPSKVLLRYRASWQRLITQMTNRQSQRILERKWKEWPTRRGIDLGFARGQPHPPSADLRRVVFGRWFSAGGSRTPGKGRPLIPDFGGHRRLRGGEEASWKSMIHCITNHARTHAVGARSAGRVREWLILLPSSGSFLFLLFFSMDVLLLK